MDTFFHGWRRKSSCVTLAMACILMGLWGRSRYVLDDIVFTTSDSQLFVGSTSGRISFVCIPRQDEPATPFWSTSDIRDPMYLHMVPRTMAFGQPWQIAYWKIIVPLAALSAFLLLQKPPKRENPHE